jgi:hypothetical protein
LILGEQAAKNMARGITSLDSFMDVIIDNNRSKRAKD